MDATPGSGIDIWCDGKPLLENNLAIQEFNLPLNAKVSELISKVQWANLVTNAVPVTERMIIQVVVCGLLDSGEIVWKPKVSGKFSHQSAYEALSNNKRRIIWYEIAWGRWVSPDMDF